MLMMRLQRVGRRNDPSYRVVVTDKRTGPKSNKHVAIVGSYNPKSNQVKFADEQIKYWLSQGVKPSPTVHNLLVSKQLLDSPKINVLPKKSPLIDETKAAEKTSAESAPSAEATASDATDVVEGKSVTTEPDSDSAETADNDMSEMTKKEEPQAEVVAQNT